MRAHGLPPAAAWLLAVRVSGGPSAAPLIDAAPGRLVSLRDARLATPPDAAARLWRGDARDTATVSVADEEEGGAWAVATFGPRVRALLGE